jgi:hypothetical protein
MNVATKLGSKQFTLLEESPTDASKNFVPYILLNW